MTDLQLYSEIASLPSNLKQEVSDFVVRLKQKAKSDYRAQEPQVTYQSKFSDILLNGPVFSEAQIERIEETRKSINEWRTR